MKRFLKFFPIKYQWRKLHNRLPFHLCDYFGRCLNAYERMKTSKYSNGNKHFLPNPIYFNINIGKARLHFFTFSSFFHGKKTIRNLFHDHFRSCSSHWDEELLSCRYTWWNNFHWSYDIVVTLNENNMKTSYCLQHISVCILLNTLVWFLCVCILCNLQIIALFLANFKDRAK